MGVNYAKFRIEKTKIFCLKFKLSQNIFLDSFGIYDTFPQLKYYR